MKSFSFALVFVSLFSFSAFSQTCPVGPNESKLSLAQVMRNFGTSLNAADMAVLTNDLSDAQIAKAVSGIEESLACAQAVLDDAGHELMPASFQKLPEEKRAAYLQLFLQYMNDFRQLLVEYKDLFLGQQTRPEASRDTQALSVKRKQIREHASLAHDEL